MRTCAFRSCDYAAFDELCYWHEKVRAGHITCEFCYLPREHKGRAHSWTTPVRSVGLASIVSDEQLDIASLLRSLGNDPRDAFQRRLVG